jgi:ATP-binding cassette subfamily F protein uup
MAPRPPLVALKNVRLQDGQRPLFDGVDIAVEPRTRAALVGRNGAGKSTLMKMVMGLIEPDAGDRSVQAGTRFAYVAQEPVITGETLLDYAASEGAERWTAEAWLATFGLDPEKPAVNLSGGEIRRAALAKASPKSLTCCCSTSRPTTSTFSPSNCWRRTDPGPVLRPGRQPRPRLPQPRHPVLPLAGRPPRPHPQQGLRRLRRMGRQGHGGGGRESLRRLNKAIERETYTFYRSITAQRTRNEGRARALERHARADRAERAAGTSRVSLDLGVDSGGLSASWSPSSRA